MAKKKQAEQPADESLESSPVEDVDTSALEASLDLIQQLGVPEVFAHAQRYNDALERGLLERGFSSLRSADPARRSGTLGVTPPLAVSSVRMQQELQHLGVACAVPDGVLRFSPHWPNALDEVPVILGHVDQILANAGSAAQP